MYASIVCLYKTVNIHTRCMPKIRCQPTYRKPTYRKPTYRKPTYRKTQLPETHLPETHLPENPVTGKTSYRKLNKIHASFIHVPDFEGSNIASLIVSYAEVFFLFRSISSHSSWMGFPSRLPHYTKAHDVCRYATEPNFLLNHVHVFLKKGCTHL